MGRTGTAFFVRRPRVLGDLKKPHPVEDERAFEIVKAVALGRLDYENFTTDFMADRLFIEQAAPLCEGGARWKCLFVHEKGRPDGVLVMPEGGCYVGWAAYRPLFPSEKCTSPGDRNRSPGQMICTNGYANGKFEAISSAESSRRMPPIIPEVGQPEALVMMTLFFSAYRTVEPKPPFRAPRASSSSVTP